jgi:hypothetical protein
VDHVVPLDVIQALGVEGNGAPLSIGPLLRQNRSGCPVAAVAYPHEVHEEW